MTVKVSGYVQSISRDGSIEIRLLGSESAIGRVKPLLGAEVDLEFTVTFPFIGDPEQIEKYQKGLK